MLVLLHHLIWYKSKPWRSFISKLHLCMHAKFNVSSVTVQGRKPWKHEENPTFLLLSNSRLQPTKTSFKYRSFVHQPLGLTFMRVMEGHQPPAPCPLAAKRGVVVVSSKPPKQAQGADLSRRQIRHSGPGNLT